MGFTSSIVQIVLSSRHFIVPVHINLQPLTHTNCSVVKMSLIYVGKIIFRVGPGPTPKRIIGSFDLGIWTPYPKILDTTAYDTLRKLNIHVLKLCKIRDTECEIRIIAVMTHTYNYCFYWSDYDCSCIYLLKCSVQFNSDHFIKASPK